MKDLITRLRYMGRQYANGQAARGGGQQKHYLEEAADALEAQQAEIKPLRDDAERYDTEDIAACVCLMAEEVK